jgi:Tfp pilus assembly protein PilF
MKAAEAEHRLGQSAEAAQHYASAANRYAEEGLLLKAVAVNKIAFGLTPDSPELMEQEANFYAQLELIHDAFESLRQAIALHEKRGDKVNAFAARRKLLAIDPDNAAGRVALAEYFVTQGKVDQALEELAKVAVQLHLHGKHRDRDRVNARVAHLKKKLSPV